LSKNNYYEIMKFCIVKLRRVRLITWIMNPFL